MACRRHRRRQFPATAREVTRRVVAAAAPRPGPADACPYCPAALAGGDVVHLGRGVFAHRPCFDEADALDEALSLEFARWEAP